MTFLPLVGIRPPPAASPSHGAWEAFVRAEYPGKDVRWFAAEASAGVRPARAERTSFLARVILRWEAWESRALRSTVPGLATEIALPSRTRSPESHDACDEEPCTEGL